jgi:hypothetical protein
VAAQSVQHSPDFMPQRIQILRPKVAMARNSDHEGG